MAGLLINMLLISCSVTQASTLVEARSSICIGWHWYLQLGELAVGEEAQLALHNVVLAHLHCAACQQLCHKQRGRQLLQIPAARSGSVYC